MRTRTDINYVIGDACQPIGDGPKIITHVVNNLGAWGAGFTKSLDAYWPGAKDDYKLWQRFLPDQLPRHSGQFALGNTRHTLVEGGLDDTGNPDQPVWVSHMMAQQGLIGVDNRRPLRYDALAHCLWEVGKLAQTVGASVHMPRIGCGLAGGKWTVVSELVSDAFCWEHIPVYVYDLEGA